MRDAEIRAALRALRKRVARLERRLSALEKGDSVRPVRKRQKADSTTKVLARLKQEGYFDTPRTLSEIRAKLAAIGHHRKRESLTNPLARAARSGLLIRVREAGRWRYSSGGSGPAAGT